MAPSDPLAPRAYLGCVPHVPFTVLQDKALNAPFWQAYHREAERIAAFDPDLVIMFGSDHYSGMHLDLMPSFAVGMAAEAVGDDGGFPGKLKVPRDLAYACAAHVIDAGIDVATSHAMEVDHGFSAPLNHYFGAIDAKPVIPVFVNALAEPRPTFRRCRMLGEAVGDWAARTGLKVAIIGTGGLSHETGEVFPQFREVSDPRTREYLLHGGTTGELTRDGWLAELHEGLQVVNGLLLDRVPGVGEIRPDWDAEFIRLFTGGDMAVFDSWSDAEVLAAGGNGAGEVRMWIAAAAAASRVGVRDITVDYFSHELPMGVCAVVVHG
ncbi:MAG: hypothetical protein ABIT10_02210 [Alteraurantiacibacter sp.]